MYKTAATAFPGVQRVDYLTGFDEEGEDYYNILGVVSFTSMLLANLKMSD